MKASVLLAAYNEEKHLGEAIGSVVAQSHEDWELILVDDGSTDATAEIMWDWAGRDPRIRVASARARLGKVRAFNTAYDASEGDVIVMLGGDDRMTRNNLADRVASFEALGPDMLVVGFHKLLMFSDDDAFEPVVIPRGQSGNRSGPGMSFTRRVAERVFPIPEELVSEDIWLAEAAECVAERVVHGTQVVTEYRVHGGNSNPRHRGFDAMSESIHRRMLARRLILGTDRFEVPADHRRRLTAQLAAEDARYQRRLVRVVTTPGLRVVDRLAIASMSTPALWSVRRRFFSNLSGWRGR